MRARRWDCAVGMMIIAVLVSFCIQSCGKQPPGEGKEQPIELSYSIFFPPTHIQCKTGEAWAKEIEKRTKGRVKITVYPAGSLS